MKTKSTPSAVVSPAPTGRTKSAQGKERSDAALGHTPQNAPSPEGEKQTSELSKEWKWVPLDSLCERITKGSSPNWQGFDYCESGIIFVRSQNVGWGDLKLGEVAYLPAAFNEKEKKSVLKTDDVLLNLVGASIGRACVATSEVDGGNVNQAVAVIRVRPNVLDPKFLVHYLISPPAQARIHSEKVDVARANFSLEDTRSLSIPLPPLPEQRGIVAEIEKQFTRLEAGVAALRRVQANLKRYRAAVLKAACEGRIVPNQAPWPKRQIATAIETMDQGWSPKCESEPSGTDMTWAVIKTTAIQNLRFLERENKTLPKALKPRANLELVPGDLLVTRAGPRTRVGVACLVKSTRPRLMLCDKAYRLRCKRDVAHPAFLELVLNAPDIQDEVDKLKTGISDSGVNLTQKRFGELIVPLPPLAEQTRIVAEVERRLSVVEELESVVTANLQRATRLRQSILQRAFTGNLR